tara:strand:+ start:1794 stop:2045 length:252 start_codon:yes stop_codon:yes gene_type:complete
MSKTAEEMMEDWEAKERAWKKQAREHQDKQISEFIVADHSNGQKVTQEMFDDMHREAQLFVIALTGQVAHFSMILEDIHDLSR